MTSPSVRRALGLALLAGALALSARPAFAENSTDLSAFAGRYVGTAKVVAGSNSFFGKSKIRFIAASATSAKILITANVKAGKNSVAVDNQLDLKSSGVLTGKELAPGVTSGVKFKGHYIATTTQIAFQGSFKVGTGKTATKGTYRGTIKRSQSGKIKLTYGIFVGDSTAPAYVYTYAGK